MGQRKPRCRPELSGGRSQPFLIEPPRKDSAPRTAALRHQQSPTRSRTSTDRCQPVSSVSAPRQLLVDLELVAEDSAPRADCLAPSVRRRPSCDSDKAPFKSRYRVGFRQPHRLSELGAEGFALRAACPAASTSPSSRATATGRAASRCCRGRHAPAASDCRPVAVGSAPGATHAPGRRRHDRGYRQIALPAGIAGSLRSSRSKAPSIGFKAIKRASGGCAVRPRRRVEKETFRRARRQISGLSKRHISRAALAGVRSAVQ